MWGFSEVAVVWTHSLLVWTIRSCLRKTCNHRLSDQGTYSHTWESRDPERVSVMVSCCCYSVLPQTLHMTQMYHFTHLEVGNPRGSPGLHHSASKLETGTRASFPESVSLGFWLLLPEPAARQILSHLNFNLLPPSVGWRNRGDYTGPTPTIQDTLLILGSLDEQSELHRQPSYFWPWTKHSHRLCGPGHGHCLEPLRKTPSN